ncbi:hypothetical protein CJD36_011055 [Flavipsychrobacter stenotrophus]|uniref:Uncharacterized protein n=2 Tax=Flavipsychrobacter stenotrophus TaxID=2077091 RepID=A0A2S7SV51_9BACT|nr:hypothetical protein CJD36_011055 [Flavipsychrobacter stenotrophus]
MTLTLFIVVKTGKPVDADAKVGWCNCGYSYTPRQYSIHKHYWMKDNNIKTNQKMQQIVNQMSTTPIRGKSNYRVVSFRDKMPVFCFITNRSKSLKEQFSKSKGFKDLEKAIKYFINQAERFMKRQELNIEVSKIRALDEKNKKLQMW